jgi:GNAT superfamily N-acetyltransferase
MPTAPPLVSLAPLERERFGVESARANGVTAANLPEVLDFCRRERVRFLTARCRAEDFAAVHALEAAGGRLMDTLVYWAHDLAAPARLARPDAPLRLARPADEAAIEQAAREAFTDYVSHYHADPRLERARCDAAYADWARRACRASAPDAPMFVGEHEATPAGFAALRLVERPGESDGGHDGEGVLYGVAPRARGRKLYLALMFRSLDWCRERGARRMIISTQLANWVPQQVWARLGFEPYQAFATFHLWLEPR